MVQRFDVTGADGVRLAAWEFQQPAAEPSAVGPSGADPSGEPAALLLHGLMGRAFHWAGTARWLSAGRRVVALDQRGHGQSEHPPAGSTARPATDAKPSWPMPRPPSSSSDSPR